MRPRRARRQRPCQRWTLRAQPLGGPPPPPALGVIFLRSLCPPPPPPTAEAEGGAPPPASAAHAALATAVIRRINPFGIATESVAASALQSNAAILRTLLDPNDRNNVVPSSRFKPASMQQGYSSGDIADFLRVAATFVPAAEAEWGDRGGAYLERRLNSSDFVRCVRRRLQGRDPLTGIYEDELYGELPGLPGAPRRGEQGFKDPWDALLIPSLRRYFYTCLADGVPPLFSEPTPAQWEARAHMAAVARAYKKERGDRTLTAIGEQWEAYCALYATTPEERAVRVQKADAQRAARDARTKEIQRLLMARAMEKKRAKMAANSKRLMEKKRAENARLAEEAVAKNKAREEARRADAARLGVSVESLGSKGKAQLALVQRTAASRK